MCFVKSSRSTVLEVDKCPIHVIIVEYVIKLGLAGC